MSPLFRQVVLYEIVPRKNEQENYAQPLFSKKAQIKAKFFLCQQLLIY